MKVNTDSPPVEEILREMLKSATGEGEAPRRITGPPETAAERAEQMVALAEILNKPGSVRIVCIGCGDTPAITDATPCVCGGWVCEPCRAMETEGVCEHEPMVLPEGADND